MKYLHRLTALGPRNHLAKVLSRSLIGFLLLMPLITTASDAFSPGSPKQAQDGGRFQPSQRINADTVVDFPSDI